MSEHRTPPAQVLLKGESKGYGKGNHWSLLGEAWRHPKAGGWNLLLDGLEENAQTLVVMDAAGYAPDTAFGVYITKDVDNKTEWYRVGNAKVSSKGKSVLVFLSSRLPSKIKLVLLPKKRGVA